MKSHGGAIYYTTFIDKFSIKIWIYFMKYKNEAFSMFKQWNVEVKTQNRKKLRYLRSNNGGV